MRKLSSYIIPISILVVILVLCKSYQAKINREESIDEYTSIHKYLFDNENDLMETSKPILWIHIPYEYNSRNWKSFNSRSSFDLNQPYLYLTLKSIIGRCNQSFKICIIDDNTFHKILPNWNVNMNAITNPILQNMRLFALMKLLYIYGGMICPVSFVCMKDLITLYEKGTMNNNMFVCETLNKNVSSTNYQFSPNMLFSGSQKNNRTLQKLIDALQHIISTDSTAESQFLGKIETLCKQHIETHRVTIIDGIEVGVKTKDFMPITLENLISQNYLNLCPHTNGILIPSDDILKRTYYEWFARLSPAQVLESDTIIGKYLLLAMVPDGVGQIIQPLKQTQNWIGFWKTPLVTIYGQKPNILGDNVLKLNHSAK